MLLAIFRFVTQLLKFLIVVLPLMIAGWFILAILLLFIPNNDTKLPALFRWFDNVDGYIGRDTSVFDAVCAQGWWARYCWMAWRNPINYFGYMYLGFQFTSGGKYLSVDPSQFNVGDTSQAGFRYIEYEQNDTSIDAIMLGGKIYYEYCYIKKWSATKCLRFRFGWKIVNNSNPIGSYCQWVFVFQPHKAYTGF